MSQLQPFVRAFRALAKASSEQAEVARLDGMAAEDNGVKELASDNGAAWRTLTGLGWVFLNAATDLEQQIAADCSRIYGKDGQ